MADPAKPANAQQQAPSATTAAEEAVQDSSSGSDGDSISRIDRVYEPLATGTGGAGADAEGSAKASPGAEANAASAAPYKARRMPTTATATTAPDDLAPGSPDDEDKADEAPPRKSLLARLGLDPPILIMMLKGSLPPTIGVAMYQSDSFASIFTTLGYLVPIVTAITLVVLPRGKFLQTLALNLLVVSVGAAIALLALYSGIQARAHTSGSLTAEDLATIQATGRPLYNPSQSTVCAIWLMFSIWLANAIRAKLPAMNLPAIVFSILINVSCTSGSLLSDMSQAMALIKQVYTAMLTGMALSAGVSLFIFPVSSRKILMIQTTGAIGLLRKAVSLQGAYLRGLEREDMYALETVETAVGDLGPAKEKERKQEKLRRKFMKHRHADKSAQDAPPPVTKEEKAAQALRATITAMRELAGKMQIEVRFAKRDAAFGKLSAHDLSEIVKLIRNIFVPVTGMSTIMDIFRRTAEHRGWKATDDENLEDATAKEKERRVWNEVMKQLHEPFTLLSEAIDDGLEHAALQLGFLPKTKGQKAKDEEARKERKAQRVRKAQNTQKDSGSETATGAASAEATAAGSGSNGASEMDNERTKEKASPVPSAPSDDVDVEASAGVVKPGDDGFSRIINEKVKKFYDSRSEILRIWARERGLVDGAVPTPVAKGASRLDPIFAAHEQSQSQLYVLLYMEQLMIATGEAVQDFVEFADQRVADGTMDTTRFLFPTLRRIRKWAISVFDDKDASADEGDDVMKPNFNVVFMGDSFNTKKDPEHLPAANTWQHFGNGLRMISRFLGSEESMFGLRVACATMTVAIVAYLRDTHTFFQEQRLVWALIVIAIGMTQTSGQSIFGFFCRICGSFVAMVFSFIIWYIADQKTPGIIVFMWLFIFCQYYFFLKYPRFIAASMITIITQVLIIAYELQVRKIGIALSVSTGQPYYPTYELAPYRLATVAGGSLVAFFWTIFPKPMTDRAWLRRDLSATLYLLANYFSVINETLKSTMHETGGNPDVPGTPAHRLLKVRQKLFTKLMLLLPSLQMHSGWQKWEPTIGGEFPRAAYEDIILRSGRILNYLTLISYTVTWKPRHAPGTIDSAWRKALSELIRNIGPAHYTILSTLALLSNALLSGQSLPPYIPLPRPYELTRQLLTLKQRDAASGGGGDGGNAATGSTGASTAGGVTGKQTSRRRNSVWGKQSWRPEKGSANVNSSGGLYERQNEEDAVFAGADLPAEATSPSTAAADRERAMWREATDNKLSTATGSTMLTQIATGQAANLGSVLDARNVELHGYTEFAVLQVCSTLVCDDLEGMIQAVSGLVGVVDFSFRMDAKDVDLTDKNNKGKGKKE